MPIDCDFMLDEILDRLAKNIAFLCERIMSQIYKGKNSYKLKNGYFQFKKNSRVL